ncbi:hypothetical protein H5410_060697 [Solanum commersonii]|uniref:Uncharacterized protein n=1 Tax=Solanum commersonii TaxID=4109 RepID=A0A9J5W5R6_SOLCO|nr:hypothetical protein H5410_060697 [Solanum commersonii]
MTAINPHDHPSGDRYSLEGDTCCFEISAPYVKNLTISRFHIARGRHLLTVGGMQMADNELFYFKIFLPLDNILRSTRNLTNLMIFHDKPKLKDVKVMPFCRRTRSFDPIKLHQFLKFLLEHAINLEKVDIVPKHKDCISC